MVHGGPYPSTSDGRSTSVGTRAIFRFTRPVCYQGFPDEALPAELKRCESPGNLAHGGRTNDPRGDPARALDSKMIQRLKIEIIHRVLSLAFGVKSAIPTLTTVPRGLGFALSVVLFPTTGAIAGCSVQTP